ncbi:hypothetical protein LMG6871_04760 [Ralstonia edaphis]|nr:hypothetical protein LMG6871_04760 [Ralstonia sp. LMG 6871]
MYSGKRMTALPKSNEKQCYASRSVRRHQCRAPVAEPASQRFGRERNDAPIRVKRR